MKCPAFVRQSPRYGATPWSSVKTLTIGLEPVKFLVRGLPDLEERIQALDHDRLGQAPDPEQVPDIGRGRGPGLTGSGG